MNPIASYLLFTMQAWSPLSAHDYTGVDRAITRARYESIAVDLETVANDPAESPLFEGSTGRAQTALLMLSIASYESGGFRADVDREDRPTGDGGHAWCIGQLHAPYSDGLTDRVSCWRGVLHALHDSWDLCPTEEWDVAQHLTGYTVGACIVGEHGAAVRAKRAMEWWTAHPWLAPVD